MLSAHGSSVSNSRVGNGHTIRHKAKRVAWVRMEGMCVWRGLEEAGQGCGLEKKVSGKGSVSA